MATVGEIASLMEAWAPADTAEARDNVGLLVGHGDRPVDCVLIALDVDDAVIDHARSVGAGMIVAHHPLIFSPLAAVTDATPAGRFALRAAEAGVAVFAAHTNLDRAAGGVNDALCRRLGLRGSPAAPGSIARLATPDGAVSLGSLAQTAKTALGADAVRVTGDAARPVGMVYVISGAGRHDIGDAVKSGADAMLTGELGYHDAQLALYSGLAVIEAGHYETEYPVLFEIENHLQRECSGLQYTIRTVVYTHSTRPFWYL